jgi:tRNA threonylcarbamoyl adenosine modification protein YjeE
MESIELESRSAGETERAAGEVAEDLKPGDVVLLAGDVGTGKTTFVRAACRALHVSDRIQSPSFVIGRRYAGRVPVAHVDLFRLESLEGEDPALLSDYVTLDSITFVEWPDAARAELDPERVALRIRIEHLGGNRRCLHASGRPELLASIRRSLGAGVRGGDGRGGQHSGPPA